MRAAAIRSVYAMTEPSRDHTGLEVGPSFKRTGVPPSTGTLNNPGPLASAPLTAIHFPSGDQEAALDTSSARVTVRTSPPSLDSVARLRLPAFPRSPATRRPSGETAGGSCSAPSPPRQTSVASPFSKRQRPSPPPPPQQQNSA